MLLTPELLTAVEDDPVSVVVDLVELLDPTNGPGVIDTISTVGDACDEVQLRLIREHLLPVDPLQRTPLAELAPGVSRQAAQQRSATLSRRLAPVVAAAAGHPITRYLDELIGDLCRFDDLPQWLRELVTVAPAIGDWGQPSDVAQVLVHAAFTGRQLTRPSDDSAGRWIHADGPAPTDRMHELADALTANGESRSIGHAELERWLRSGPAGFRIGSRSVPSVMAAMIDDRVALRFDDRFVVFSRPVRTSTVERSDGAVRTRRRGSALSRVEAVESLLPDVGEADLLNALQLQYGMSQTSIAVLRAELRRRPKQP